jgi:hypothetical protein
MNKILYSVIGMMKSIFQHMYNWLEVYWWLPMSLLCVWLSVEFHFLMTGRPTGEDPYDWITGFAPQVVKSIIAIALVSISKEAFGSWLTKEEKIANPMLASVQSVCSTITFLALLYFLGH